MTAAPLASFRNGGYSVSIFADGTKIRETLDASTPPVLPEHMDLKITQWCDAGCAWCHEQSTVKGQHGDLDKTLRLLEVLPAGAEIAIGGGDPLSHPGFEAFVRELAARGVIPSVTVNGRHFDRHRDLLERLTQDKQLFGVGFSYADKLPDWDYEHLVLHLIAGVHPPAVLDVAMRRYKVLILGYKEFGRGRRLFALQPESVKKTLAAWFRELFWVGQEHHLSFDNLAIAQLRPSRLFKDPEAYVAQHMGEEGQFGMYVDAVTQTFALSSYSEARYAWSNLQDMFAAVRKISASQ